MRLALLSALLVATAAPRSGCGDEAAAAPATQAAPHPDCAGKRCGDPCNPCGPERTCPTFAATACDAALRCVTLAPGLCWSPCAGKACGSPCQLCPPDAAGCVETMVVKACNAAGACVPQTPDLACPP
jgi:hypothetical protein